MSTPTVAVITTPNAIGLLVTGSIAIGICMPTMFLILLKRSLRIQKEYIVIVGAILMESVYNAGFLIRAIMYLSLPLPAVPVPLNTWICMVTAPYNVMFVLGIPLTGLSVLLFSIDRLIAVLYPIKYYLFTATYATKLNIAFAIPAAALLIFVLVSSYLARNEIQMGKDCTFALAITELSWIVIRWSRIAFVLLAVIIYIPIGAIMVIQQNRFIAIIGQNKTSLMMRRMTITIGLTLISAFFLLLIPELIIIINWLTEYSIVLYLIAILRSILNLFIYTWRHKELRKTLCCWQLLSFNAFYNNTTHIVTQNRLHVNKALFISRNKVYA